MNFSAHTKISELVAEDTRTARVFQHAGIDFCCKGYKTIEEACKDRKIELSKLLAELKEAVGERCEDVVDFNGMSLDKLANYIEHTHHSYVRIKIEEIKPLLEKIVKAHGQKHPELSVIEKLFLQSEEELIQHMIKEEKVLFPYIRQVVKLKQNGSTNTTIGSAENPIKIMKHDHETEAVRFRTISQLSNNYTPPSTACNTYRLAYTLLKEFQSDLFMHLHLENNVLFPKVLELEKSLAE